MGPRHASRVSVPPSKLIRPHIGVLTRLATGGVTRPPRESSMVRRLVSSSQIVEGRRFRCGSAALTSADPGLDNRRRSPHPERADKLNMSDDPIQALVSGVLDRVNGQLQRELAGLVDGLHAHTAEARALAAQAARSEAESAAAALASGAIAAERSAFEGRTRRGARRSARTGACRSTRRRTRGRPGARRSPAGLGACARRRGVAERRARCARDAALRPKPAAPSSCSCAATSCADGRRPGSTQAVPDARAFALPLADAGVLAAAVTTAAPVSSGAADSVPAPLRARRRRSHRASPRRSSSTDASSRLSMPMMAATRRAKCPARGPSTSSCWRVMPRGASRP